MTPDVPTEVTEDDLGNPYAMRWLRLTHREEQVARAICAEKRNSEIAEALEISTKTVDTHRLHVLKKLGVVNNVGILRLALKARKVEL